MDRKLNECNSEGDAFLLQLGDAEQTAENGDKLTNKVETKAILTHVCHSDCHIFGPPNVNLNDIDNAVPHTKRYEQVHQVEETGAGENILEVQLEPNEVITLQETIKELEEVLDKLDQNEEIKDQPEPVQEEIDVIDVELETFQAETKAWSVDSDEDSISDITITSNMEPTDLEQHYYNFMCGFRHFVKTSPELVMEKGNILKLFLDFPFLRLRRYLPGIITSTTLRTIRISTPSPNYGKFGFLPIGCDDMFGTSARRAEEKLIRDRVVFLLRNIHSHCLRDFVLVNDEDGWKLNGVSRMDLWEEKLKNFLFRHHHSLEKIQFRSLLSVGSRRFIPKEPREQIGYFPNLKDLELVFWESLERKVPPINDPAIMTEDYWVKILKSRAKFGQLHRLIWSSAVDLPFQDVWKPVIQANKDTLKILHILGDEDLSGWTSNKETVYTSVSCAVFSSLKNLESLYLRRPSWFLYRLELLPESLQELLLDGPMLESQDIIGALKKLGNLKKLRLVGNTNALGTLSSGVFGVNGDVIVAIVNHRSLNDVFVWGVNVANPTVLNGVETIAKKQPKKFKKVKNLVSSLFGKSQKLKAHCNQDQHQLYNKMLQQTGEMVNELAKFAVLTRDSISIK